MWIILWFMVAYKPAECQPALELHLKVNMGTAQPLHIRIEYKIIAFISHKWESTYSGFWMNLSLLPFFLISIFSFFNAFPRSSLQDFSSFPPSLKGCFRYWLENQREGSKANSLCCPSSMMWVVWMWQARVSLHRPQGTKLGQINSAHHWSICGPIF